jgi:phytoene dehydrogenase-like protein
MSLRRTHATTPNARAHAKTTPTATIVGAGPNGLSAAVVLARAGVEVTVLERNDTIGGGARTAELTLPGYWHDVCSAVHPMAFASGFFRRFGLTDRVDFVTPEISYAQPLDGGDAGLAYRDLHRTAEHLGVDGDQWLRLMGPLVDRAHDVAQATGSPLTRVPRHPIALALFGVRALELAATMGSFRFREDRAPAMLAGVAAHAIMPMPRLASSAAGLVLSVTGHQDGGWPIPIGGSQAIVDAMADDVRAHGGRIETGQHVTSAADLPDSTVTLFDTTPRALVEILGDRMPAGYRRALERFQYGNGVAKVDFALSGPVPWTNEELHKTGTLHLGGTAAETAAGENQVARGKHPDNPYVLVSQPTRFDPSRAPEGKHTLWAYTHVPADSDRDMTEAIVRQIERFAPGFRDVILASSSRTAQQMEGYNPNYIGGDISAGEPNLLQLIRRPTLSPTPWRTAIDGVYLCSSATPPGPGVTGLPGAYAATAALRDHFGVTRLPRLGPDPV